MELRESRARLMRDRRRAREAAPPGPDDPASGRSRWAASTPRGLKRCDTGRGVGVGAGREGISSGMVSLLVCGCGLLMLSEGAHDIGRARSLRGGRGSGEPLELA
jgi:hypothetical protein